METIFNFYSNHQIQVVPDEYHADVQACIGIFERHECEAHFMEGLVHKGQNYFSIIVGGELDNIDKALNEIERTESEIGVPISYSRERSNYVS